jgi:hypothetical protein
MTRSEKVWCLAVSVALVFVTTLPFLIAFERQGPDLRFTGSVLGVEDGNSYVAKMRRGSEGDWLFRTPYTAKEQTGVPAFLEYLLLGKLAGGQASHEQLVCLLHLARILAIPLAVYATYKFISRFLPEARWRKWATLVAVAGGGLGWLVFAAGRTSWLGSQPLEVYSPETFGFLAALTFPHLLLARAFLLLALDAYLQAAIHPRAAWAAVPWLLGLAVLQPLSIAAAAAAIGAHQVLLLLRAALAHEHIQLWDNARPAVIALAIPLLVIGGYILLLRRDPFLQAWAAQNLLASPQVAHYLLAYGLLLPCVLSAMWRVWRDGPNECLLLVGWALMLPILAYAPVAFQRRLPEGGWVALSALAAIGLAARRVGEVSRRRTALGVLALSLVGSALLLVGATQAALQGLPPAFQRSDQVAGFEWLAESADQGVVVLASYETGNALPAWAPDFVLIGHGPESAGLTELEPRVRTFYASSGSGPEADALLREFGVSFVFVGDAERSMGFSEARAPSTLIEVFRRGEIAIFRVSVTQSMDEDGTGRTARADGSTSTARLREALAST